MYIKLNNLNVTSFINILKSSNIPNETVILKCLAKACYREGVNIQDFIPILNASDILDIHRLTPKKRLNAYMIFHDDNIYMHLMNTASAQMFALPAFTYIDEPLQRDNVYTIENDELKSISYGITTIPTALCNEPNFNHKVHRILFKLEKYNGFNEKLKDMYQVTYAYACDLYYIQLKDLLDQGQTDIELPCICNPYLVQYYQNYRNSGWEFNRNSHNSQYNYNKKAAKRCNVDHTLLIDQNLVNNLLQYANLNIRSASGWTGIINGEIEPHRHKTAKVSVNKNLIGYKTEQGRYHTCENMRLKIKDTSALQYPDTNFDETAHIRYITRCIAQTDAVLKENLSKKDMMSRYGYIFNSLLTA